jgi:hypothetical protein
MQLFECKPDVVPVVVADPFAGVDELLEQIRQTLPAVQERLSRVRTVVHCVTGGTTLLGYGATRFADEARRLGLSVTTVAAVDRRSPEEQRQRPFELGELVELPGPHTETFGSSNPVEDDA